MMIDYLPRFLRNIISQMIQLFYPHKKPFTANVDSRDVAGGFTRDIKAKGGMQDDTEYTFVHVDGDVFVGTSRQLRDHLVRSGKLSNSGDYSMTNVFSGRSKHTGGWFPLKKV